MTIKKVNIDQLLDLLMEHRKHGEWVDIRANEHTNTILIGLSDTLMISPQVVSHTKLDDNNLNQLIV